MKTKLLELTSDVVFKSFMMSENTNKYKARLISLITDIPESVLLKAKYVSKELPVSNKKDKVFKTDIIIYVENHIISMEMNKEYYDGLFLKNSEYALKVGSEQFDRGDNYLVYKQVIQISIDDFKKFKKDKLVYKFEMMDEDTLERETDLFKSYHINLPYLKKLSYNKCNELERLFYLFKDELSEKEIEEIRENKMMNDAYNELEKISSDEKIIGLYDKEKVERKILNTRIISAKNEGRIEGEKSGISKGKKEEKLEIASNMLKKNYDINDIVEITGLTKKEIEKIDI